MGKRGRRARGARKETKLFSLTRAPSPVPSAAKADVLKAMDNGKMSNGVHVKADIGIITDGPVDALPQRPKKNKKSAGAQEKAANEKAVVGNGTATKPKNGKVHANGKPAENGDVKPKNGKVHANGKPTENGDVKPKNGKVQANGKPAVKEAPEIPERPELEELPKRQLWIVRVPSPAEDEHTPEDIQAMEEKVAELTVKINKAQEIMTAKQEERNAARSNLVMVRDRMREVANDIREKFAQAKPLQDRVNSLNSVQTEVKDIQRELKVQTEDALDQTLEDLEFKMSHETLTVLQQKAILRQIKILKNTRDDIKELHEKRAVVADSKWEKDECYAQLKLVRGEIDILKQQEAVQKKIFDHYKAAGDAADAEVKRANERRGEASKERWKLSVDLRAMRKPQGRDKSEFWRARRTVGRARELVKNGNIAEAEALCLEQMEHMHARLNMDDAYRAEYYEAMAQMRVEREQFRAAAREAAQKEVEEAQKVARAKIAEAEALKKEEERLAKLAQREAEKDERMRAREAEKAAAAAAKAKAEEAKRKAEEAAAAKAAALAKKRAEIQANAQRRKPAEMPDIGPRKMELTMMEAEAHAHGHHTPEAVAAYVAAMAEAAKNAVETETPEEKAKREAREKSLAGRRELEDKKKRLEKRKEKKAEDIKRALENAKVKEAEAVAKKEAAREAAEAAAAAHRRAAAADAALMAADAAAATAAAATTRKMPAAMKKRSVQKWWQDENVGMIAVAISLIVLFFMCLAAVLNGKM